MFNTIKEILDCIYSDYLIRRERKKPENERDDEYIGILTFGTKERYQEYLDSLKRDRIKHFGSKEKYHEYFDQDDRLISEVKSSNNI